MTHGNFKKMISNYKGKAQVSAQDKQGLSPLHLAAHEGYDKMAKILIENGN